MEPFDVKRFVTWFLILAAITSPLILVLANFGGNGSSSAPQSATESEVPKNAFVEKVPESFGSFSNRNSAVSFTDNLTSNLSAAIIKENPEGPQPDTLGQLAIALPKNIEEIAGQYTSGLSAADIDPKIDESKIQVLDHFTAGDISTYALKAQGSLSAVFQNEIFQNAQSAPGDPEQALAMVDAFYFLYSQAEGELYALSVPKPLLDIDKRLLRFIEIQKNFFDQNDPAKTILAIKSSQTKLETEWSAIENAIGDLEKNLPDILSSLPGDTNTVVASLHELLGIRTAYASDFIGGAANIVHSIFGAGNFFENIAHYLQVILQWVYKLLTEVLKDQLIHKLVQQVIDWVNGGGKPQFVTNWKEFLGSSFNNAIGGVIAKVLPGVCKPFQPFIKIAILPTNFSAIPAKDLSSGCSLDKVINNIEAFGKSFENGGWIAYGATLKPSNNLLGSLIEVNELALTEAAKKQEAAKNDATSGSGYKSQQTCTNQSTYEPGGEFTESEAKSIVGDAFVGVSGCSGGVGGEGPIEQTCTKIIICGDPNTNQPPQWSNTTPASVISGAANNAISGSPIGRIVNANDITALVSALVNAGLNKLIAAGKDALTGEDKGGLASLTPNSTKTVVKDSKTGLDKTCKFAPGSDDQAACLAQNKGIVSTEESAGQSERDNALNLLDDFLQNKRKLASVLKDVVKTGNSVISNLLAASTTCASVAPQNPGVDPITGETLPLSPTREFIDNTYLEVSSTIRKLAATKDQIDIQLGKASSSPAFAFTYTAGVFKSDGTNYASGLTFTYPSLPKFISTSTDPLPGSTSTDTTIYHNVAEHSLKDRAYFTQLSQDLNIQGSAFGRAFGSSAKLPADLANAEAVGTSYSNAGCALLERSTFLLQNITVKVNDKDKNTFCDIAIAKKVTDCH